jgi:hypothetical protein
MFPHRNPVHASPLLIRATCLVHSIILDFITRTIVGEESPLIPTKQNVNSEGQEEMMV